MTDSSTTPLSLFQRARTVEGPAAWERFSHCCLGRKEWHGNSICKMNQTLKYIAVVVLGILFCWPSTSSSLAQTIEWSGMTWDVKSGTGLGPGPNNWSDSQGSVWVDDQGNLHLIVRQENGIWYSSEIYSQDSLGYGSYEFRIESNTENYDPNVVAGLFTYLSDDEEIDIELTRFGNANRSNAHFTVQPYHIQGNSIEFDLGLNGNFSTHSFNWTAEKIDFESLHGHHTTTPTAGHIINQWTYTGGDIPTASSEKVHINFWLFQGNAPYQRPEPRVSYRQLLFHARGCVG